MPRIDRSALPTGLLWLLGPVWYLLCEAIAASQFPGYSYADFYISDLGVPEAGAFSGRMIDSHLPIVMNAGFIGEGVLFLIGLVLLVPLLRRSATTVAVVVFGALHTAGIIFVGLVPGSPTNAENGLILIHGLGACAAIAGGNLVAVLSARALPLPGYLRRASALLGSLGFLSAALLIVHAVLPDGVWERGSVYTFLLWQLLSGIHLCRGAADSRPDAS